MFLKLGIMQGRLTKMPPNVLNFKNWIKEFEYLKKQIRLY